MITPTYHPQISGREMFEFNPEMVEEDDLEATDEVVYRRDDSKEDEEVSNTRHRVWLACMIIIYKSPFVSLCCSCIYPSCLLRTEDKHM